MSADALIPIQIPIHFNFSRAKATVMISILVFGYVIFWTPFHVYGILHALGSSLSLGPQNHKIFNSFDS